jgi:stearoyl-CoA desaturase (delta-9 desaturase)
MGDVMELPQSLLSHRVSADDVATVCRGEVRFAPVKSFWFFGMATAAIVGGAYTFSWGALAVFFVATGAVLLLGHSLGSHRKLIHDSYACPKWLEYFLVYMGVQVGLSGPLGLMRAHDLRDYAQRLPICHDYLRHGSSFWKDAWWQLNCELRLESPPRIAIEARVANDCFYRFLERTWMLQQLPPALALYAIGGWGFVFYGVCARVTAGVLGHWLIGYFAHNNGGMHFEVADAAVQGQNIRLTSILTMGECWHNNHHAFPGSARLGLFAGEWDPGWWTLLLLHRLGLAWNFRLPQDLPARAELHAVDFLGQSQMTHPRYTLGDQHWPIPTLAGFRRLLGDFRPGRVALPTETRLEWPAAILSQRSMRCLVGDRLKLLVDPALHLLVLHYGEQRFTGFPAVCLAFAQRSAVAWLAAWLLMPVAVMLEASRRCFALERGGIRHVG